MPKSTERTPSQKVLEWRKMKTSRLAKLTEGQVNILWNNGEKRRLLRCLRENGCDDMAKLQAAVRTKSREQIEYFIDRRREWARRRIGEPIDDPAIEVWVERATKELAQKYDYSKAVAEAVARGSQETPNYAEVYRFLVRLLKSEPTPDLSAESSAVILKLLKDLATVLRTMPLRLMQTWFTTLDFTQPLTEEAAAAASAEVCNARVVPLYADHAPLAGMGRSFNPLNISPQILQLVNTLIGEHIKHK